MKKFNPRVSMDLTPKQKSIWVRAREYCKKLGMGRNFKWWVIRVIDRAMREGWE